MKRITFTEFLTHFDESLHNKLKDQASQLDILGHVAFRNDDFCSSNFGHITACCYGPTCTYKTIKDFEGKHIHDLPSQREYPFCYWEKES